MKREQTSGSTTRPTGSPTRADRGDQREGADEEARSLRYLPAARVKHHADQRRSLAHAQVAILLPKRRPVRDPHGPSARVSVS
eukprot:169611-Prymnesium_polylepis.1